MFAKIVFPRYLHVFLQKTGIKGIHNFLFLHSMQIYWNKLLTDLSYFIGVFPKHIQQPQAQSHGAPKCAFLWSVFFLCLFNWQTAGSGNQYVNFLRTKLFLCFPFHSELYEIVPCTSVMLPARLGPSHFWYLTQFLSG